MARFRVLMQSSNNWGIKMALVNQLDWGDDPDIENYFIARDDAEYTDYGCSNELHPVNVKLEDLVFEAL